MALSREPISLEDMIIKNRWKLISVIGKGAFGQVYLAFDLLLNKNVAVKIELPHAKKQVLKLEISILKKLNSFYSGSNVNVCEFLGGGRFIAPQVDNMDALYTYLVMNLAGTSISELRKQRPNGKFSVSTTALLGVEMLRGIKAIHEIGILHRDIKPGNFCVADQVEQKRSPVYIIDFGLSRRYLNADGSVRDERTSVGFRGTARYASIAAHSGKDLGRVDDLWSLYYMTVEMLTGTLPWKGKEKEKIGNIKKKYTDLRLLNGLPQQLVLFYHHLLELTYTSRPNYDLIEKVYKDMFDAIGAAPDVLYDWETRSEIKTVGLYSNESEVKSLSNEIRNAKAAEPPLLDGDQTQVSFLPTPPTVEKPLQVWNRLGLQRTRGFFHKSDQ